MIVINHEVELPTVGSKVYVEVTVIRHPNSFSVNLPYGNVDMAKVSIAFLEEQKTVLESWAMGITSHFCIVISCFDVLGLERYLRFQ